jgi:uncharacterized repeat protein (TIGR01451 family)
MFTDTLPPGITVAAPANASTTCEGGVITAQPGASLISYGTGGFVSAGSSCTINVDVTAASVGLLGNTSGELTSFSGGSSKNSGKAGAVLEITADTIHLDKNFLDDPVLPGDTVTLAFAVTYFGRDVSATDITFSDDLDATLAGLRAVGLPTGDPCGPGSTLTGTGVLTLSGGSLAPGETCGFQVSLQVPAGAVAGNYPNTTSSLTADIGGLPGVFAGAADNLFVSQAPLLAKTFLTDPVGSGEAVTLEFTITNISATSSATDIAFTDNLGAFLSGIEVSLPPSGFCGGGSTATFSIFNGMFTMAGGSLDPSSSCTFSVDLTIPIGASPGVYTNTTSAVSAVVDATSQTGLPASDSLTISAGPVLRKSFSRDRVMPGETVTLEFTLTNTGETSGEATAIAFTDDLSEALAGLSAIGLPLSDICGSGSSIAGTTSLGFSGGSLAAGQSCTFGVTLQVPAGSLPGRYTNTTSTVTALVAGNATTGPSAHDDLLIGGLDVSQAFTDDPVIPGETVTLEFTITNTAATAEVTDIGFTDNLNTVLSGLAAIGLPLNDICGPGSTISGAGSLSFSGGALSPGSSCTFDISLQVPPGALSGTYANTTSAIQAIFDGFPVVLDPARDSLVVDADLLRLTTSFTNDPVLPGATVNLAFSLTNLHAGQSATDISFTDDLDAALTGLAAIGLPASVCGGTLAGTDLLTFTGGFLAPGASCSFSVELQVPAGLPSGTTATNTTSQVTGKIGGLPVNGAPAGDALKVSSLSLIKAFGGTSRAGKTVTLQFAIDNNHPTDTAADLRFSDNLGAMFPGLVATGLPLNNICGTGSLLSGTGIITLSGATLGPEESCSFSVSLLLPLNAPHGFSLNTTSPLTVQGLEVAAPASALLEVDNDPDRDGILDRDDNCPDISNPDQSNNDGDNLGDVCDPDDDNDGVPDISDNCRFVANADQADFDGDGGGNACDVDDDNDGMPDSWEIAHGLNPYDPSDAERDDDGDGFSNLEEHGFGSDPNVFDEDKNNNGVPDSTDARRGMQHLLWYLLYSGQ